MEGTKVFKTFDDWKKVHFPSESKDSTRDKTKGDPVAMGALLALRSLERAKDRLMEK